MITKDNIRSYQEKFLHAEPEVILREVAAIFGSGRIALASSLGAEDQVLTAMAIALDPGIPIFTIDTGRLPQETYDVMVATMKRYGFKYDILFPDRSEIEKMESEHGPNLFYESREKRLLCCRLRKVEPLKRRLSGLEAWICGLRREQSPTRTDLQKIEWDESHQLIKINPLADWSLEQVWNYLRQRDVPYNALHDKGYASIGCTPCTRAVQAGEDIRAGRWWWEAPEHKECGLHGRRANIKKQTDDR